MMIGSASRTVTRRDIDAVGRAGRRPMVRACASRTEGFRYAPEHRAWTSFRRGGPFDEVLPSLVLARLQAEAEDWFLQAKCASLALPACLPGGRGEG